MTIEVEFLDTIFIEGHTDNRPCRGFMGKGVTGAVNLPRYFPLAVLGKSLIGDETTIPAEKQMAIPFRSVAMEKHGQRCLIKRRRQILSVIVASTFVLPSADQTAHSTNKEGTPINSIVINSHPLWSMS